MELLKSNEHRNRRGIEARKTFELEMISYTIDKMQPVNFLLFP